MKLRRHREQRRHEEHALAATRAHLARIRAQWPDVRQAVATLDEHGRENGFTQKIRQAIGGDR